MEGVMMRGATGYAMAVRRPSSGQAVTESVTIHDETSHAITAHPPSNGQAVSEAITTHDKASHIVTMYSPNGEIAMIEKPLSKLAERIPILKWPLIRGVVALCSSMSLGFTALSQSADIAFEGVEEEPESRFEKWMARKFGDKLNGFLKWTAMLFAIVIAIGLFMLLPTFIASLIPVPPAWTGVIEGFLRIIIFVLYVFLVSRAKDIQRVFQYHGAEHKAINCHEAGLPLTTENVAASNRLHKRCGTSFMLVVMVIAMLLFVGISVGFPNSFINENIFMRMASRVLLLPVIAALSFEVSVKWAGKRDNFLVRMIIFPGMLMQRMTTKEPDESQIEIAVVALERCLQQDAEAAAKKAAKAAEEAEKAAAEAEEAAKATGATTVVATPATDDAASAPSETPMEIAE